MSYIYRGCSLLQGSEVVVSCKLMAWHSFKEVIITKPICTDNCFGCIYAGCESYSRGTSFCQNFEYGIVTVYHKGKDQGRLCFTNLFCSKWWV